MVYSHQRQSFWYRLTSLVIAFTFAFSSVFTPSMSYAQGAYPATVSLPNPGSMLMPTEAFVPAQIIGLNIHPENPLRFDFIVDEGNSGLYGAELEDEASKMIKYFLAALAVPEEEMWVNLSPYEKDRIIPSAFGKTEMGRDLLAQDYLLKQLTASLMYPEEDLGEEFWSRVQEKATNAGVKDIPFSTFNKVWIVPEEALIYEHAKGAVVVESRLKVMLEEDYLAMEENQGRDNHGLGNVSESDLKPFTGVTADVVREVIIPEIEKEVNEGRTFANLRQIFNAVILAAWYKNALRQSLLGQLYVNQKKVEGIEHQDPQAAQKIYNRYLEAFKLGVYDFIKDEYDPNTQEVMPRKYFSGGVKAKADLAMLGEDDTRLASFLSRPRTTSNFTVDLAAPNLDIAAFQPDSAMLASVEQRIGEVYEPWLNRRMDPVRDRVQALSDDYFAAKAAGDSARMKAIDAQINALVDEVNIDQTFQQRIQDGTLQPAATVKVDEFKAEDGGVAYQRSLSITRSMLVQGGYVPQFIFAGKATRLNKGAMFPLNLWEIAQEQGKVESGQESPYGFGMGPRQIIAYRMFLERIAAETGESVSDMLARQQLVININDEVESEAIDDLVTNNFYGFNPENIFFINQPEFKGYRLANGQLVLDPNSAPLVYGHGDNAKQLNARGEAYRIDAQGRKTYLEASVLELISGKMLASHRINDMTKLSSETVVDLDKLVLAVHLHNQGHAITADLVSNPLKSKGGTATNIGLLETLAAKGSPELMGFINQLGDQGAPYNAFRLTYDVDSLRELLEQNDLPYYLRFKDGFFYLEAVTGDLTQFEDANTRFIQREGDLIQDFKELKAEQVNLMTNAIVQQDRELTAAGVAPGAFSRADIELRKLAIQDRAVPIAFGTSGWRTDTASGFNAMNVGRVAKAAASVIVDQFGPEARVAVGYDARPGAREFARIIVGVLKAYGVNVDFVDQVTPTPVLAEATRSTLENGYDVAFQVTASHNPVFTSLDENAGMWQGIKVLKDGIPASDEFTGRIAREANDQTKNGSFRIANDVQPSGVDLIAASSDRLKSVFDFEALRQRIPAARQALAARGYNDFGVLLDSMGGTTAEAARVISELGIVDEHMGTKFIFQAHAEGTLPQSALDPNLNQLVPWRPEPQSWLLPDLNAGLKRGKFGAAMDGDGDRAVFLDIDGTEISPNELGLIFAHYLYERKGERGVVVRTIPTTHSLDRFAANRGLRLEETPVGSKHFAPFSTGQDEDLLVGIEESGHVFFKYGGEIFADSAIAEVLLALEIIITEGKSLSEYLADIYAQQGQQYYVRTAVDPNVVNKAFTTSLAALRLRVEFPADFARAVAAAVGKDLRLDASGAVENGITYDLRDKSGVKVNFADGTFTMYRISGTDGSVRIYAEDTSAAGLNNTTAQVSAVIQKFVADNAMLALNTLNRKAGLLAAPQEAAAEAADVGGIDLNPAMMKISINREGDGVIIPPFNLLPEDVDINGLKPVIINVAPVYNLPLLIGLSDREGGYAANPLPEFDQTSL